MTGFILTRLTLSGPEVPDAEVHFRTGLNVISGPSDTGKTFIAECIDFVLGASQITKEIPESAGYETVSLGLSGWDKSTELVLERSIRGGGIRLHEGGLMPRIFRARHQAGREDTVSHFLLERSGLVGKKVRQNQRGVTRSLSFRDLSRLIFVDEGTVISRVSPVLSGEYTARTTEISVFRLLLTGVDDSTLIATEDRGVANVRRESKAELVGALLLRIRAQIDELNLVGNAVALRAQLADLEAAFDDASVQLAVEQEALASLEQRRRTAWRLLREAESRVDVLSELQVRFGLLQYQYSSDLKRLEAISESAIRLGQMTEERCPVCGALAVHHDPDHRRPSASPSEVANACVAEAEKIRTLAGDLKNTRDTNAGEIERLASETSVRRAELQAADEEIRAHLQQRVELVLQRLRDSQTELATHRRAVELYDWAEQVRLTQDDISDLGSMPSAHSPAATIGAAEMERFSKGVEDLLRDWHFPNLGRVTFSESDQDIMISGRRRASYGKGVRAITHAAFNLALLKYCRDGDLPHPGLVVIDSPLVVYREPDAGEIGFNPDLKPAFYRSLAAAFKSSQVIILENEEPPRDIQEDAWVVRFTGASTGRFGFIPATD